MISREGMVAVPGGKVWYRVVGEGGEGVPLLVLHGGPGGSHDLLAVTLGALADERPVIFYDQLGSGNSEHPDDPSLWRTERFVEELHCVREGLGLTKVHLLGQSWGTMLAVLYLLEHGSLGIAGLVLSAPFLSGPRWIADQQAWLAQMPEDIRRIVEKTGASGDFENPAYKAAMTAYYHRHICRMDPWPEPLHETFGKLSLPVYLSMCGPSEFALVGLLKDYDLTPRLKEIDVPTLFTCGRYDEATPETTEFFRDLVPGSRMVVFEESAHLHHLEHEKEYRATVREFLREAECGAA